MSLKDVLLKLRQHRRRNAYIFGVGVSVLLFSLLFLPANAAWHAPGRMTNGHDDIKCDACHKPTPGTLRQKLQANSQYLLGGRNRLNSLGHGPVGNEECVRCHDRPDDHHPVFRFFEPRYAKVRKEIQPQFCVSCHIEHKGVRVTAKIDYCSHCHQNLKIHKDPITISHATLVKERRWRLCLGCHDFHGNHRFKIKKDVNEAWSEKTILSYFEGGPSPYGREKIKKAKRDGDGTL